MKLQKISICVSLMSLVFLFQNCGQLDGQSTTTSGLNNVSIPSEGGDTVVGGPVERVGAEPVANYQVYDLDNVINSMRVVQFNSGKNHLLAKPYESIASYPIGTGKSDIIYFHCSGDDPESCVNELEESARVYCKEIGGTHVLSKYSVSLNDTSGSFSSATRPEDPYFTIRLKSGEHIETDYRYVTCLSIDLELYRDKVQPIK